MENRSIINPYDKTIIVVKVLNQRKVVINRGSVDDIRVGQRFLIYSLGDQLTDPSDGRDLGRLEIVKGRGKVTHLQEKIATVESIETDTSRVRKSGGGFPYLMHGIPEMNETVTDAPFEDPAVGDYCRPI